MIGVTGVFPIPGKQVGEPGDGNIVDPSDDVSQLGVGVGRYEWQYSAIGGEVAD